MPSIRLQSTLRRLAIVVYFQPLAHSVAMGINDPPQLATCELSPLVSLVNNGVAKKSARSQSNASRLINLSARADVGTGSNILVAGFVISGTENKEVLLRGIGPALAGFGVSGVLANPELNLFNSAAAQFDSNYAWTGDPFITGVSSKVGAFSLQPASADCALLESLPGGSYTAQVSGFNSTSGIALAEVYDADSATGPSSARLANLSARANVGSGASALIGGFAIAGTAPEPILIRGIGPGLAAFGLSGALQNPLLTLFDS